MSRNETQSLDVLLENVEKPRKVVAQKKGGKIWYFFHEKKGSERLVGV